MSDGLRVLPLDAAAWSDERGWGVRPLEAAGMPPARVGELHLVSLEPGAVRGNHRHPHTTEWLLLCGGPVTLAWGAGADVTRRTFSGDVPVLVEIPPDLPHAVRSGAAHPVHLCSWADGEPTTRPVEPLLR